MTSSEKHLREKVDQDNSSHSLVTDSSCITMQVSGVEWGPRFIEHWNGVRAPSFIKSLDLTGFVSDRRY